MIVLKSTYEELKRVKEFHKERCRKYMKKWNDSKEKIYYLEQEIKLLTSQNSRLEALINETRRREPNGRFRKQSA